MFLLTTHYVRLSISRGYNSKYYVKYYSPACSICSFFHL
ncbi:hypothetical protein E2C01_080105 [Portunus trituberculatus]|uniref:Uncharacterized protein n=1 Tax=Portunus trituberculatus TaxID=210409 RepID=A0A5B7IS96_PORTR|nr:hypothetical protein [Portunus trituberculatus]